MPEQGRRLHKIWSGYKGHILSEEDTEIITAVETTPANKDDGSQLPVLLDQQKEAHAIIPEEVSGDKGYDYGANLETLATRNITGNISLKKKTNTAEPGLFTVDDFKYDFEKDTLTCPAGHLASYHRRAVFNTEEQKKRGNVFQFKPEQCGLCPLKDKCHRGDRGRAVYISYYEPFYREMKERMESEAGKNSLP